MPSEDTLFRESLWKLSEVLPTPSSILELPDVDSQARAVLALAIELALAFKETPPVDEDPGTCPNCSAAVRSERSPYCGEPCREMAGFVRQTRTGVTDGSIFAEDRQTSLGQVLWHVLGGGYPRRQLLVLPKARERVFAQTSGRCDRCGEPATTFDHIGSACNRPINLRPLCAGCTQTHSFGDPVFLAEPRVSQRLQEIGMRLGAPSPLRCCDDSATWDWRAYLKRRIGRAVAG